MPSVKELRSEVLKHKKGDKPVSKMTKHELLTYVEKYVPSFLEKPTASETKKAPARKAKETEEVKVKVAPKKKVEHLDDEEVVVEEKKAPRRAPKKAGVVKEVLDAEPVAKKAPKMMKAPKMKKEEVSEEKPNVKRGAKKEVEFELVEHEW
jgi:hypothetical protein